MLSSRVKFIFFNSIAIDMHCSWELNKKNIILLCMVIKITSLAFFFTPCLSLSLSLSHLWSSSLSSSLFQLRSLKLTLFTTAGPTHCQRHRPTSRPKPLINLRPMPPITSDPLLFRRSNPCRHCPPHRSPALWLVIFYFVCDWWFCLVWVEEKVRRFWLVVFFFFLLWTGGGGGGDCGYGW